MITIYNIAEQCRAILGKGNIQELVQASKNAYATAVKNSWYEGKNDGVSELNGSFVYTFKDIKPILDIELDMYYIVVPSSFIGLPHNMGINLVSFMKGQDKTFAMLGTGVYGMISNLKSFALGGRQAYYIEGTRMYFPKMKKTDIEIKGETRGILLKMAIALDDVDVDEQLNIPSNIQDEIVTLVVNKYREKPKEIADTLS